MKGSIDASNRSSDRLQFLLALLVVGILHPPLRIAFSSSPLLNFIVLLHLQPKPIQRLAGQQLVMPPPQALHTVSRVCIRNFSAHGAGWLRLANLNHAPLQALERIKGTQIPVPQLLWCALFSLKAV